MSDPLAIPRTIDADSLNDLVDRLLEDGIPQADDDEPELPGVDLW